MEMTHVVTFTVDKILDKADLAQSFCHKFVQICLQNEKWKILLSNPASTAMGIIWLYISFAIPKQYCIYAFYCFAVLKQLCDLYNIILRT